VKKKSIYVCWLIVLIGCAVSLYYGEILMIEPCRMCWYQRMALFPLALILGIGIYRNDRTSILYAIPLCVFGLIIALIQALGIHFPSFQICEKECAKPIFSLFGWITFPDLSAAGFALISALLITQFVKKDQKRKSNS
jgi:disulfide bond formation protein DsbB